MDLGIATSSTPSRLCWRLSGRDFHTVVSEVVRSYLPLMVMDGRFHFQQQRPLLRRCRDVGMVSSNPRGRLFGEHHSCGSRPRRITNRYVLSTAPCRLRHGPNARQRASQVRSPFSWLAFGATRTNSISVVNWCVNSTPHDKISPTQLSR